MLTLVDRYVLKQFLGFFLGGLLVFITIFLAVDAMSMTMRYPDAPGSSLMNYYLFYLPEVIYQMVPVACLLGVLFTLSTMNRSSELLALFAAGLSLMRICLPIFLAVGVLSGLFFTAADQLLPRFVQIKNYTYYHEIKKKPAQYSTVKTDRIWYRSKNTIFNIKTINRQKATAEGLTLYQFNEHWDLVQMMTAGRVELLGRNWKLLKGSITLFSDATSFPLTQDFDEKVIAIDEELGDIQSSFNSVDVLSLKDLKRYIQKNKEAGLDTVSLEVVYHDKFASLIAAFVMVLLGIPFSVNSNRQGGMMINIGFCLLMVVIYWTLKNSSLTLGHHGNLPPVIAAWGPNLLMTLMGLGLVTRTKK
jgi:lipopolysaccharide export system permease protein